MHKTYFVTAAHFDISRYNNPLWSLKVPSILLLCCWKGPSGEIISMKRWSLCNNAKVGCVSKSSINGDVSSHCIALAPRRRLHLDFELRLQPLLSTCVSQPVATTLFNRFSLLLTRQLWEDLLLSSFHAFLSVSSFIKHRYSCRIPVWT